MAQNEVISSLTPAQEAQIPVYRERFRQIGLSTRPTDRVKAEDAIRRAYAYLAKSGTDVKDPEILWAESPMAGAVLAAQHAKGDYTVTNKEIQEQASLASYGSFEAYWVSVYAFIAEQLPVQKDELAQIAVDIVEECGVYWTFEDLVILTPKPTIIKMNDSKLHSADGPALQYPNGDGLYAIDGQIKNSLMEVMLAIKNTDGGDKQQAEG